MKKHRSIDSIASRASLVAVATTLLLVGVFTSVSFIQTRNSNFSAEERRLGTISRNVARSLAAELLLGDEKSVDVLREELKRQYELSELQIVEQPPTPIQSNWWSFLRPSECKKVEPLPGFVPARYAVLESNRQSTAAQMSLWTLLMVCLPLGFFGLLSTLHLQWVLRKSIVNPIRDLASNPEGWRAKGPWVADETVTLHRYLMNYIKERDAERDRSESLKIEASIGKIASQVAHDIRSPLAALDMVAGLLTNVPEQKRILIRGALARIRDIANGLLETHRAQLRKVETLQVGPTPAVPTNAYLADHLPEPAGQELLSSLVDSLITEKRMQFRSRWGVEIEAPLTDRCYGLFASVEPTDLKRVLSNLINNAVEAIEREGRVSVELESENGFALLRVSDNGSGISRELMPRLLKPGATHGKQQGMGLGLADAKTKVESWGGSLQIRSVRSEGTIVELRFPLSTAPSWFVEEIRLSPEMQVIILDDDASIHQIWQGRFESLRVRENGVEVRHLSTSEELVNLEETRKLETCANCVYLIDFELIGSQHNGLELIQLLNLHESAILVTSRFEESSIRAQCQNLGVRLIPKSLAGFVPIRVENRYGMTESAIVLPMTGSRPLSENRPS